MPQSASAQQIDEAYTKLVEKYGPHVRSSEFDPDFQIKMMHKVNEAYSTLMNPMQRKIHDDLLAKYPKSMDVSILRDKFAGKQPPTDAG